MSSLDADVILMGARAATFLRLLVDGRGDRVFHNRAIRQASDAGRNRVDHPDRLRVPSLSAQP